MGDISHSYWKPEILQAKLSRPDTHQIIQQSYYKRAYRSVCHIICVSTFHLKILGTYSIGLVAQSQLHRGF